MDRAPQVGVIALRQAGTAAAFAPVVRHLRARRPERALAVFCYPPARATWEGAGLDCIPVAAFADAKRHLEATGAPQFVLTGTSLEVTDDACWWDWAAERRVPSIAFVDQWVNYWQRFAFSAAGTPHFDRMPDRIAVVDDVAAARLASLGGPSERIVVTGSPSFDALFEVEHAKVAALRDRLSEHGHAKLVVFACEPATPPQTSVDIKRRFGFCEDEVVALVATAAADTAARLSQKIHVVFKRHPIQIAHGTAPHATSDDERAVSFSCFDGDRLEIITAADVVIGMRSMLLFEAALLGRRVISVQPQRLESCDLTDGRPGIEIVDSALELHQTMFEALAGADDLIMPGTLRHAAHDHARRFAEQLELV
jgi:hypothetical protein